MKMLMWCTTYHNMVLIDWFLNVYIYLFILQIANVALTTEKLDQSVSSELPGNPPIWIARRDASQYQYDLYANDARVIRGDIRATSSRQDEQVSPPLYIFLLLLLLTSFPFHSIYDGRTDGPSHHTSFLYLTDDDS